MTVRSPIELPLLPKREPAPPASSGGTRFPLLALGFRPFYLLAAAWAAAAVPLWIVQFFGWLPTAGYLSGPLWHAHEMLFGFAAAVIVGFLFTAGQNWTGLPTPRGKPLAALALLWCLGRVLNISGPPVIAAVVDVSFLVAAAVMLGRVLVAARNARNFFMLVILLVLAIANALFHAALQQAITWDAMPLLHFSLFLIVLLTSVMGGRVIPMFTANAAPGIKQFRNDHLDMSAVGFTGAAFLLVVGQAHAGVVAAVAAIAALLQAVRLAGWNPLATRGKPLLWVLHVSYAWIPVGLALIALGALGWVQSTAAMHVLGLGAIGGLIIGMITRTALGHTGRVLQAGKVETTAYALVQMAVMLRVLPLLTSAAPYMPFVSAAAVCWSLAFVLYLVKYTPMLCRPRIDGRPG